MNEKLNEEANDSGTAKQTKFTFPALFCFRRKILTISFAKIPFLCVLLDNHART